MPAVTLPLRPVLLAGEDEDGNSLWSNDDAIRSFRVMLNSQNPLLGLKPKPSPAKPAPTEKHLDVQLQVDHSGRVDVQFVVDGQLVR